MRIIFFILLILGTAFSMSKVIKYSEFVTVDAKIIDISILTHAESESHQVTYEIELEGQIYKPSIEVYTIHKDVNDFEKIRCNPNNLMEIEDKRLKNFCIGISIFLGVILIGSIVAMCIERFKYYRGKKVKTNMEEYAHEQDIYGVYAKR